MAWLVCGDKVVASLERADTIVSRMRGLLGRSSFEGALLIRPTKAVHSIGMKFPIDVAYCDKSLKIVDLVQMKPNRLGRIRFNANSVIEAQAGSFERWNIKVGDSLEVKE